MIRPSIHVVAAGALLAAAAFSCSHSVSKPQGDAASGPLAAAENILTLPHREVTLPNGLRVFMVKYPSPGVVAYQLPVHAGSRNEVEAGKTGFAHFFEHLMFRGTKHRSSKQFGDLYTRLGVENNAWTSNDITDYHGVTAGVYLPQILDAEADRFANLSFDEKALRDEAGAVLGEYNKDVAQPEFLLEEKLSATAFKVHPYAHTTMGYKEDILKFTERYDDVWPFFHRYYRPGNVAVVLVGDLDFDPTLAVVEKKFGAWKDSQVETVTIPAEPLQTEPRSADIRLSKPTQTRIAIAYKVPAFHTVGSQEASRSEGASGSAAQARPIENASLAVLSEMLFSVTSEFQKEYRFKRKWLDSVSASPNESVDPGLWTINLRLADAGEGHEQELVAAVEKAIAQAREQAPAEPRLAATKKRFRNSAITSWFSSPESLAHQIAWYTNFEPDLGVLNRVIQRVDEVTPASVLAFARAHLVDSQKTVVTLHGAGK